ncbi:MAG TPA: hypothetical protein VMB19_13275 [Silvibacterium sp.]|nr:hypothetical protein [Silvibacterium sp.]
MIGVKDPDEYRRRRAEFLDKLVLKNPDINLLQSHPKEQVHRGVNVGVPH